MLGWTFGRDVTTAFWTHWRGVNEWVRIHANEFRVTEVLLCVCVCVWMMSVWLCWTTNTLTTQSCSPAHGINMQIRFNLETHTHKTRHSNTFINEPNETIEIYRKSGCSHVSYDENMRRHNASTHAQGLLIRMGIFVLTRGLITVQKRLERIHNFVRRNNWLLQMIHAIHICWAYICWVQTAMSFIIAMIVMWHKENMNSPTTDRSAEE